jgi:hypothetical protein
MIEQLKDSIDVRQGHSVRLGRHKFLQSCLVSANASRRLRSRNGHFVLGHQVVEQEIGEDLRGIDRQFKAP